MPSPPPDADQADATNRYDGAQVNAVIDGRLAPLDGVPLLVSAASGATYRFDAGLLIRDELSHFDDARAEGEADELEEGAMFGTVAAGSAWRVPSGISGWMEDFRRKIGLDACAAPRLFETAAQYGVAGGYRRRLNDCETALLVVRESVTRPVARLLAPGMLAIRAERERVDECFQLTERFRQDNEGRWPWGASDPPGTPESQPTSAKPPPTQPLGLGEWDTEDEPGSHEQAVAWHAAAAGYGEEVGRRETTGPLEEQRRRSEARRASHVQRRLREWLADHPTGDDPRAYIPAATLRCMVARYYGLMEPQVRHILQTGANDDPAVTGGHVARKVFWETIRLMAGLHAMGMGVLPGNDGLGDTEAPVADVPASGAAAGEPTAPAGGRRREPPRRS